MAMALVMLWYLVAATGRVFKAVKNNTSCDTATHGFQCSPEVSHFWGQYSPYFSVPSDIGNSIPEQCTLTMVQILSRHGSRDPTTSKTAVYKATIQRIQRSVTSYGAGYEFLRDYVYDLGADQLSIFGRQQLINSGSKFYERYGALTRSNRPFVRSSGQDRVLESAQKWIQGFQEARLADAGRGGPDEYPSSIVVIPEGDGVNNTLNHELCTAFEHGPDSELGNKAQTIWRDTFTPNVTARLNANLPGANLTATDTISLMDLCPFNTVANVAGKVSDFCRLFTEDEWRNYDYYQSVGKWYGYSNGNPLGPTQGVGFTNELIARMTGKAVQDETSTNHTLDSSGSTFPLDRTLYADFSHDTDMTAIFSAMGLYNGTAQLSNTTRERADEAKGYSASWTVPFAARMYVEKMTCEGTGAESLVRVLVNDRVVPLQNCGADKFGRCRLSRFVDSLSFARSGGNWAACFSQTRPGSNRDG